MIIGIGTDLVDIKRIEQISNKKVEQISNKNVKSFVQRVFSESEQAQALTRPEGPRRFAFYATRFAAKEACAKALGTGIRDGITFQDMVVSNDPLGKPILTLYNKALERLEFLSQGKGSRIDLSLSDEYPMSVAFVIISME
jgi:holo-[acyl-carrier protein] synthase